MVVYICYPRNGRKHKIGGSQSRLDWAKSDNPISRIIRPKKIRGMAQAVEHLP
jgi:hypothetical protein